MAVKPSECTQLQMKEIAELTRLEDYIDKRLLESYIAGESVKITINKPSDRVYNQLISKYKKAGWAINLTGSYNGGFRNEPPSIELSFKV